VTDVERTGLVNRKKALSTKIEEMKKELNRLITNNSEYDEILEYSKKIDLLITEYMQW
jgi:hypothetical protein